MYTFNGFFWENLLRFSRFRLSTSLLFLIFCGVWKLYMMEDDLYLVPFSSSKGLFVTLQLPLPLGLLEECQKHVFHVVLPISAEVLKHFHGMKTDHTNKIQWLVESLILNQELFRWIFFLFVWSALFMDICLFWQVSKTDLTLFIKLITLFGTTLTHNACSKPKYLQEEFESSLPLPKISKGIEHH